MNHTHKRYDWNELQEAYNKGYSYKELKKIYGVTSKSIQKAIKRGQFKPRPLSESMKRSFENGKRDRFAMWTPERRKAQSEAKKKLYAEHPEKHPNRKLANNRTKMSYPEKLVNDWLTSQGIEFIHQRHIDKYFVDFNIGSLCIEVDGKAFHNAEYDANRDKVIESLGFKIRRVSASNVIKHGASIVLDESISDTLLSTHIELRTPHICPNCNTTYYGRTKTCSMECRKLYRHNTTVIKPIKHRKDKVTKITTPRAIIFIPSKDELTNLVNEGIAYDTIGKQFSVSGVAVRKWCKKYGINYKRQKPIDESKLIEMVNTGIGVSEIAREFEVTSERIQTITKKLGLTIVNKKPKVTPPETVEKIRELISKGKRNVEIAKLVGMDHKQISAIRMRFAHLHYH